MNETTNILIVDDNAANRDTLEALLTSLGHELRFAQSGEEALKKAIALPPDLILLDVNMPGMDGFEVCEKLRADSKLASVPIVITTSLDDKKSKMRGIEVGADDFITKPIDGMEIRARVKMILRLNRYRKSLQQQDEIQRAHNELQDAYEETLKGWVRALDARDRETELHSRRVTLLTKSVARQAGIADQDLEDVRRGALLHDIGKIAVPDHILRKPGPLTDAEWVIMRTHPKAAYDILKPIKHLANSLDIPYCHHERWDGAGYPRGLKGDAIPLSARIFAVIDVWDALLSDRPYRKAWEREKVIEHIQENSGTHFDPVLADLFLKMMSQPN
ncbi:MAG: HD domain-containing phosphohydrolase [Planctomycetota bacterium]